MVSVIVAQVLSFIFTAFIVILILNLMHEGDVSDFIKLLLVSAIMLFAYPYVSGPAAVVPQAVQTMVNSFIAWTAMIKITSGEVTFAHAAITAIVATVFIGLLLPLILGIL